MVKWKQMRAVKKGDVGYVAFYPACMPTSEHATMILCEVVGINMKERKIEVTPIAGDSTCLWIDSNKMSTRVIE